MESSPVAWRFAGTTFQLANFRGREWAEQYALGGGSVGIAWAVLLNIGRCTSNRARRPDLCIELCRVVPVRAVSSQSVLCRAVLRNAAPLYCSVLSSPLPPAHSISLQKNGERAVALITFFDKGVRVRAVLYEVPPKKSTCSYH